MKTLSCCYLTEEKTEDGRWKMEDGGGGVDDDDGGRNEERERIKIFLGVIG